MSVDNLKDALPEYAKDLKLNLGSISRSTVLNEEQLWGTLLASAAATRNTQVLAEIGAEAADILSSEAYQAALGAASIMGMNNVFYRGRGFLDGKYDDLRPGRPASPLPLSEVQPAQLKYWRPTLPPGCSAPHEPSYPGCWHGAGSTRPQQHSRPPMPSPPRTGVGA